MTAAFGWGTLAGSSLVIGALIALRFDISLRAIGLILGFGAGVLISAVSFDLVEEAYAKTSGHGAAIAGLFVGCGVFFAGDKLIDRYGGSQRKDASGDQESGSALAIVLGTVLDGIPDGAGHAMYRQINDLTQAIGDQLYEFASRRGGQRPCGLLRRRFDPVGVSGAREKQGILAGYCSVDSPLRDAHRLGDVMHLRPSVALRDEDRGSGIDQRNEPIRRNLPASGGTPGTNVRCA